MLNALLKDLCNIARPRHDKKSSDDSLIPHRVAGTGYLGRESEIIVGACLVMMFGRFLSFDLKFGSVVYAR